MLRKILILLIKFIPVIQMTGMLINNTLYYFDIYFISYSLDYLFGNSIITTILFLTCSYIFKFCIWHRLFIISNFISVTIAFIDCIHKLPITDLTLLIIYYVIASSFIIVSTIIHINKLKYGKKTIK